MTDIVTPDDLKQVYQHAQKSDSGRVLLSELTGPPFSFTSGKGRQVLMKLVQNRLAYVPKEFENSTEDFGIVIRKQEVVMKLKGLTSPESYAIYQTIEQSGSEGISSRDISRSLNDRLRKLGRPLMQMAVLNRSMKSLETDKMIKAVKSVSDRGRKLYLLYDLEPNQKIAGGCFYKDGEFNTELVDAYRQKITTYLASHHMCSKTQLLQYIFTSELGQQLTEYDIDFVIHSLILDQIVIESNGDDAVYSYAAWPSFEDIERLPCTSCPLQDVCQIEDVDKFDSLLLRRNDINPKERKSQSTLSYIATKTETDALELSSKVTPSTCPYYNQWLRLTFLPWVSPDETPTHDQDNSTAITNS
ncbi:putative RNA polymerase subunit [Gregarina niphandrodes]|uniref:RNA polymerase subunit n=1 Tax=Gregarina niphandrodes TaxID=110365 RepID=A0A023B6M0_GRENI|nr:putative RNA polymerase subunit [Gregarina niphandrodes]EZG66625.1 putative RNA polymerase subunit [Gregarina niphandrodes]|eukprot:XP_011130570.1 putative RNA polymerase subunit [Gregarina niphandrodes]